MSGLSVFPVKTKIFNQGDSLEDFVWQSCGEKLFDGAIVAVTSKIVSLAENRVVEKRLSKEEMVRQEADVFLCKTHHDVMLTIKHGLVIPSSGIDESNAARGGFIIYPVDPYASAEKLCRFLKEKSALKNLGVIITDSHTSPLRKGVTGVALSHWGFKATKNLVGVEDLFKSKLKMTHVNLVDSLAVASVLCMGEAAECQPIAIVKYPGLEFTTTTSKDEISISLDEDLYGPLLTNFGA